MRWSLLLVSVILLSAGCLGVGGDGDTRSRLYLSVQNDGSQPISFRVTLTEVDGTILADETQTLNSSSGQSFDFTVGTAGRHEIAVTGSDWAGELAWTAETCARYDAVVRITDERVAVAGECLRRQPER